MGAQQHMHSDFAICCDMCNLALVSQENMGLYHETLRGRSVQANATRNCIPKRPRDIRKQDPYFTPTWKYE
jgi:hypothetical protein